LRTPRREPAEARVRPLRVVVDPPVFDRGRGMGIVGQGVLVQASGRIELNNAVRMLAKIDSQSHDIYGGSPFVTYLTRLPLGKGRTGHFIYVGTSQSRRKRCDNDG